MSGPLYLVRLPCCVSPQLGPKDLAAVEIVGGGMRPRCVKRVVATTLDMKMDEATNHELSTTLNMDESVSRGAALACAMLSPLFRVKPFTIIDGVSYPVRVSYGTNPDPSVSSGSSVLSLSWMRLIPSLFWGICTGRRQQGKRVQGAFRCWR